MSKKYNSILFLLFVLSAGLAGCRHELKPGHYEGTCLRGTADGITQEAITIEVSRDRDQVLSLELLNQSGKRLSNATVRKLKNQQIEIRSQLLSAKPVLATLVKDSKPDKRQTCYANLELSLDFCFKSHQFLLQILDQQKLPILQISGNAFGNVEPLTLEAPVTLKLSDAVQLALTQNFDSRIEYEHVVQAGFAAKAAYLQLVPHLSSNLIWNASPNYITFIATLQALAPFLLPTYWFDARSAGLSRDVEDIAQILMQANLATSIEELTYSLLRDQEIVAQHHAFAEELNQFQEKIRRTNLPAATSQLLMEFSATTLEAATSDQGDLEKLIRQDRFSIAQTMGYHSLEAVAGMTLDRELVPAEQATYEDPIALGNLAMQRSFELEQLKALKRIAALKRLQNLFAWLDPTSDPKQSLGLNTFPQQKSITSQVKEIGIREEQEQTLAHQRGYQLALDYNEALTTYHSIRKDLAKNTLNLDLLLLRAQSGENFDLADLKAQGLKHLATQVATESTLANYRIARAKKDRLLLQGYYLLLLPRLYFPSAATARY
jgi:hypothetical protein